MSERASRIGLTTYREPARWGVWDETADLLPTRYARGVEAAGGVPVLLPPLAGAMAGSALDGVHALLLAGGADVDPERYGQDADPHTGAPRRDRDEWEIALVHAAVARDLPMLAVCRGMQVLNVALGGDLLQHLPDTVGHDGHCPTVGVHGRHDVMLGAGGALAAAVGERLGVATYHHQGVSRLGAGLTAAGWAEDGTVEAVELAGATWVVGVQWHPEVAAGEPLFAALVSAADAFRDRTGDR